MVDGDVDISEQALNVVLASVRVLWACLKGIVQVACDTW